MTKHFIIPWIVNSPSKHVLFCMNSLIVCLTDSAIRISNPRSKYMNTAAPIQQYPVIKITSPIVLKLDGARNSVIFTESLFVRLWYPPIICPKLARKCPKICALCCLLGCILRPVKVKSVKGSSWFVRNVTDLLTDACKKSGIQRASLVHYAPPVYRRI